MRDEETIQLYLEQKCGNCRSEIKLHIPGSLILIYTVQNRFLCVSSKERLNKMHG